MRRRKCKGNEEKELRRKCGGNVKEMKRRRKRKLGGN